MNKIQVFNHEQFGSIRTMEMPDGQIGFVGKDVAVVLGYSRTADAIRQHVDDEDKGVFKMQTPGGVQSIVLINESGLYALILSSKLPQAREFKHWVTAEVLPQIRQTGGYIPVEAEDDEKTILARAMMIMQRTLGQKNQLLEERERLIREEHPKVLFADAVTSCEDSILISEMAKLLTQNGYEIGRTRFFSWLRDHGYLFRHSTEPIQKWVERGIFDTHVTVINTHHGQRERITTKVTGKGQQYFINLFINK